MKQIVRNRVKESQNLKDLESLIESNQEYFGDLAGAEIDREKLKFDQRIEKGRFGTVVAHQEFYKGVIETLEKASLHMKNTVD